MKQRILFILTVLFFYFSGCLSAFASGVQEEYINVGETRTINLPSDVSDQLRNALGNPQFYVDGGADAKCLDILGQSNYSVTVKALSNPGHKITLRIDYRYLKDSRSIEGYHVIRLTINGGSDPGSDPGTIPVPDYLTVTASPAGGKVKQGTKVTLTANNYSAIIRYTLDGTDPKTNTNRKTISSGESITINESCTLKAYAVYVIFSDVYTWNFTVEDERKVLINEENFPDKNFRDCLYSWNRGSDGVLTEEELSYFTSIHIDGKDISNLKGIEFFTHLKTLSCGNNKLKSLDLSKNTALTDLYCYKNQLEYLDVSKLTQLKSLNCWDNKLTSLDVSKNTALTKLYCDNNQLEYLDVSKLSALESLSCYSNKLKSLDVSKNTALTFLQCHVNQLEYLDVSKLSALNNLICAYNKLKSLDVSKNTALTSLECAGNELTALDVSRNVALNYLGCHGNKIKGVAMDNLIQSLPVNKTNETHYLRVHSNSKNETNECTKKQVKAAKARGWTPAYQKDGEWVEYEGSDEQESPNLSIVSFVCDNTNLSNLTKNDKLVFHVTFKNSGGTGAVKTAVKICDSNMNIKYSGDIKEITFRAGETVTVDYVYDMKDVAPGNYNATVMYYDYYSDEGQWYWIYNSTYLKEITVKEAISSPEIDIVSVICNNANPSELTQDDILTLRAVFKNSGSTAKVTTVLGLLNIEGTRIMYHGDLYENEFANNMEYTHYYQYPLKDVAPGEYLATALYYNESTEMWIYKYVISIRVKATTGIDEVKMDINNNNRIFNMSGQKLDKPQKGINIINGRKVVVK